MHSRCLKLVEKTHEPRTWQHFQLKRNLKVTPHVEATEGAPRIESSIKRTSSVCSIKWTGACPREKEIVGLLAEMLLGRLPKRRLPRKDWLRLPAKERKNDSENKLPSNCQCEVQLCKRGFYIELCFLEAHYVTFSSHTEMALFLNAWCIWLATWLCGGKEKERKVISRCVLVEVFFSQVLTDIVHIKGLGRSVSLLSAFSFFIWE